MTAALRKGPGGGYCRNKVQTQLTLKKATSTGTFSSHTFEEKEEKQRDTGQDVQHP